MFKHFKKSVLTKLDKLSVASVPNHPLALKRIARSARAYIPYQNFKQFCSNTEIFNKLEKTFINGLIVTLDNGDYWNIKNSIDPIDSEIVQRIGKNDLISSVIVIIQENGEASNLLSNLKAEHPEWTELRKNFAHNITTKTISSNLCWAGEYVFQVSGGNNSQEKTKNIQLANDGFEYADEIENENIKIQLGYLLLCCNNSKNLLEDPSKLDEVHQLLYSECLKRNILDFTKFEIPPLNAEGLLQCCLTKKVIDADAILGLKGRMKKIELCHIEPRSEFSWKFDGDRILTAHRLYNLMWGIQKANVCQGEETIEETEEFILEWADSIRQSRMHD